MSRTEILLESGTNEIEIMKFTIHDEMYGINVAKVREIMMADRASPIPHSHPAVEGIFKPRDTIFTVVDLPYYLTGAHSESQPRDLFMITNFNKINIAFRVHSVVGIERMSWKNIDKPDRTLNRSEETIATGITQVDGKLIIILDFEKIISEIAPQTGFDLSKFGQLENNEDHSKHHILVAEDSMMLMSVIKDALSRAGYENVYTFNNGQELWEYICSIRHDSDFYEKVSLIITDIEMPQMDGHKLTDLIKSDIDLRRIPLIIFSSLINEEMEIKGRELGADAQLSKPEVIELASVMSRLLKEYEKK